MEKRVNVWDAIVVSAKSVRDAETIEKELFIYQRKGIIPPDTVILTISDPYSSVKRCIGSGGATINALYYVVEQLSARKDFQVLTPDVLYGAKILVVLHGRPYPFGGCSRAFTLLPWELHVNSTHVELNSTFIQLYSFVTDKAAQFSDGLWVCSSDMLIRYDQNEQMHITQEGQVDACMITFAASADYATNHGVVKRNQQGLVEDIIYMGSKKELELLKEPSGSVPLVSGIVYLSVPVTESLLLLQASPLLESCTYLGNDVGSQPQTVSLFFDILLAMCTGVEENDFLLRGSSIRQPNHGEMGDAGMGEAILKVRRLIWNSMRRFKLTTGHFEHNVHEYMTVGFCAKEHLQSLTGDRKCPTVHSITPEEHTSQYSIFLNSIIHAQFSSRSMYVFNSFVDSKLCLTGENMLINVDTRSWSSSEEQLILKPGICLQVVTTFLPLENGTSIEVPLVYGITDVLMESFGNSNSTFCGMKWDKFFDVTGITTSDLWPSHASRRCAWTAKLFPVICVTCVHGKLTCRNLFWAFENVPNCDALQQWRLSERCSMAEIFDQADLLAEIKWRKSMFYEILGCKLKKVLSSGSNFYFLPYFRSAEVDGYSNDVLASLDAVAMNSTVGVAARAFALIADVLGTCANGRGGLRSGPSQNEKFAAAFRDLEAGNITSGVSLMAEERKKWMSRADLLIRCARHYEGAAQICIRQAVSSAIEFISLKNSDHANQDNGMWYVTECPARIDLSGGWTDTPPIAYEKGGLVVNCALLVNGERPVGAKIRKTSSLRIRILGGVDSAAVELSSLSDLKDFCIPNSPGALVKACLLFAKIVDLSENQTLEQQLSAKWNCGFDISIWSTLPQGSGMGTSSILAGAIIATLWTVIGQHFDHLAVVHAVLCIEQMLTTGGGWQDQVGGIYGGFKAGSSASKLPLRVTVCPISPSSADVAEFNSKLLLVYTGKPRLAKNLLQNVVRNWYAREAGIVSVCDELVANARRCQEAFTKWNMDEISKCITTYYEQKKLIAPGTEPASISRIIEELRPFLSTWTLAGAGGGGFLFCLLKRADDRKVVTELLGQIKEAEGTTLYSAVVDVQGMHMYTTRDNSADVPVP